MHHMRLAQSHPPATGTFPYLLGGTWYAQDVRAEHAPELRDSSARATCVFVARLYSIFVTLHPTIAADNYAHTHTNNKHTSPLPRSARFPEPPSREQRNPHAVESVAHRHRRRRRRRLFSCKCPSLFFGVAFAFPRHRNISILPPSAFPDCYTSGHRRRIIDIVSRPGQSRATGASNRP